MPEPPPAASPPGIAVLGGTFDPPHRSHLRLARAALEHLPVAELRVIPAGDHPHKRHHTTPAVHRLAMCRIAFRELPGARVDDRELRRQGPSFTVDTLAELAAEAPGRRLFFLIGSDNLPLLPTWHDHHRLLRLATVVTYPRAGCPVGAELLAGLDLSPTEQHQLLAQVLRLPADATAASDLRQRWRRGERNLPELDPAVEAYLTAHRLYAP
jgi:nicotinate-nucleotide adenylyltransferase